MILWKTDESIFLSFLFLSLPAISHTLTLLKTIQNRGFLNVFMHPYSDSPTFYLKFCF